jgi:hypothetical protein
MDTPGDRMDCPEAAGVSLKAHEKGSGRFTNFMTRGYTIHANI